MDKSKDLTVWVTISVLHVLLPEGPWFAKQLEKACDPTKFWPGIVVPIVAACGRNDDFGAYIGLPKPAYLTLDYLHGYASEAKHTSEGCKKAGDKIPEILARQLFPELAELVYRI